MGLTEQEAPFTEPYALAGNPNGFKSKGNTALALKRALAHLGFLEWEPDRWDKHYNAKLNDAAAAWKRKRGLITASSNDGSWGKKGHDVMRSAWYDKNGDHLPAFDGESQRLLREEHNNAEPPGDAVPNLGPVWRGGLSVLDHDLTHATGGIDLFPAFDDAFVPDREIIAPEALEISQASSSNPGDACYALGASDIEWWFGHLVNAPAVGKRYSRGQTIGRVLDHSVGGGPHVHVGINVETLLGAGQELEHHTDYTHGAPTVGEQLARLL